MSAALPAEAPAPKPTLHEIAAMPYSAGIAAMRAHYDPKWGDARGDDSGEPRTFRVAVHYTVRQDESEVFTVEACSADEAEKLAEAQFRKRFDSDCEIEFCNVDEVGA